MSDSDGIHISEIATFDAKDLADLPKTDHRLVDDGGGAYHFEDAKGNVIGIGVTLPRAPGFDNPIDEINWGLALKLRKDRPTPDTSMPEADLAAWGLKVKGNCFVCGNPAVGICLSMSSLLCGTPLCENCPCPVHHERGYRQSRPTWDTEENHT